jgi:ribosomal protein L29
MELDDVVLSLEEELATNKSDLEHLRLQLRAVQVLVPADADRDLLQSIENWKADYLRLKMKMAARRRERNSPGTERDDSSVGLGSPSTSTLMERAGVFR